MGRITRFLGSLWRAFWGCDYDDRWVYDDEVYAPPKPEMADRVYLVVEVILPWEGPVGMIRDLQTALDDEGEQVVATIERGGFFNDPRWPLGSCELKFKVDTFQSDGACPAIDVARTLIEEEQHEDHQGNPSRSQAKR
jgi:hypothetical protein